MRDPLIGPLCALVFFVLLLVGWLWLCRCPDHSAPTPTLSCVDIQRLMERSVGSEDLASWPYCRECGKEPQ